MAARAAAAKGVDLEHVSGSGPSGRITKSDVLAAADRGSGNGAATLPAPAAAGEEESKLLRGGAAALARYMSQSLSIPTATSFRTLPVTMLDARRRELKEAGRRVSFTHLIAYAIAQAAEEMPVMRDHYQELEGKPHRIRDGAANLGIAVDVEKTDGTRTLMVPVIRDAGRLRFDRFVEAYDAIIEKARHNRLAPDDLSGANITLTNPGGLGTVASVPRLMAGQGTIVASGSIGYPVGLQQIGEMIGAEKVVTMTSTYDHRIIQGAESGRFLGLIEERLAGEHGFYEQVFEALEVELGPPPLPPAPAAAAAAARAPSSAEAVPTDDLLDAVHAATIYVTRVRSHGHLAAHLDPLGSEPEGDPGLDPQALGLTPQIQGKLPASIFQMYVPGATLADALPHLTETYCGTIAYEVEHIASHRQRVWLREHIESGAFRHELTSEERITLLKRLVEVDALERFMHKAYLGQHQFSIEGLDMTVPMLDELIQLAAAHGGQEVVVGMAHRGRLNVLAHNLGRAYDTIFAEFEGASTLEAVTTIPQGGTGDVKYHHGTEGSYELPGGGTIRVNLESNPSHLEYVSPVVEGATRAAQTSRHGPHAHQDTNAAVPIVIHGDASFPGQGVVSETLNLQALDGYKVGGTVHIIMNNQVGFTTDPDDARSTRWASDLAKGFDVPIIHVNADDVPACVSAVRLAFAFRKEFGHDVLIDLIGYRRFGHNESDEPAYTQPEMYAKIKNKKRVAELWSDRLVSEGVVTREEVERQAQEVWDNLTNLHQRLKAKITAVAEGEEHVTGEYQLDRSPSPEVETALPVERLRSLGEALLRVPDGFTVHPKLVKQLDRRREALAGDPEERDIDWAHGEALAFASLLTEGTPIRLTGQDTERGTFSQRHMVLHDAKNGQTVCPIQNLPDADAPLELHNSPLSELACMGFEYGYSQEAPETLVLWEAQFGDFVNSAQVIIDQFIVSGLAKWGQTSRLTLLLPHGYEGSGPEHSSARLERFLRSAAEGNIRVASPTTPAQYFHLLRRQARIAKQRPLAGDDAEVAPAPAPGRQRDRRHGRRHPLSAGDGRAGGGGREGHAAGPVHRQDLLRPHRPARTARARGPGGRPCGAAVPVPGRPDPRADRQIPQPEGDPLGPGGAAQHGRPRPHVPAADADHAARDPLRLRRAARAGEPRARAIRPPTWTNRTGSSPPPSTCACRSPSTPARPRVSADGRPLAPLQGDHGPAQAQAPRLLASSSGALPDRLALVLEGSRPLLGVLGGESRGPRWPPACPTSRRCSSRTVPAGSASRRSGPTARCRRCERPARAPRPAPSPARRGG